MLQKIYSSLLFLSKLKLALIIGDNLKYGIYYDTDYFDIFRIKSFKIHFINI